MNIKKKAQRDFKQLNDFIEKAAKTSEYEFTWHYEGITIEYNYQNQGLSVDLGTSHQFNVLSIGEVELVLRSLLMIYDLNNRDLIKVIKINTWTKTTMQYNNIHAYLKDWREYNENDSFNWLGDRTIEDIDVNGVINCLLITLSQVRYTEGEYWTRKEVGELDNEQPKQAEENPDMKDLSPDHVRIYDSVPDFCWAFRSHQGDFIKFGASFKNMLFSEGNSRKYISIVGYNGSQINVTFHETPQVVELEDVMSIVRLMRTLLKVSYSGGEYGVDFNYKSYPDDMLSYVKDLLAHTPVHCVECVDKYDELEQEELEQNGKYLYELYERAYMFLGKWLDYAEKWQEQHDSESNSDNYYTDDSGQDMFAKFEALDDFREQTYALGFCYHNIEKYLVRAGRKTTDPTADINKALDYLHEYRKLQKIYFE